MQLPAASASVSSAAAAPVPPYARLLRRSRAPAPFPHLRRRRCSASKPLALTPRPPLPHALRSLRFVPRAHGHGGCHCHHHHHHHHHHNHHHGHGHHGADAHGGGGGAAVMRIARAIGWAGVADALREHAHVCCISLGLLAAAAACPHVAPLGSVKHLQAALMAVAFPLVGSDGPNRDLQVQRARKKMKPSPRGSTRDDQQHLKSDEL
ncbi:hypothetical protein ACP70R_043962 [Stipagrostis hirtigluma subsp. patula]